MWWQYRRERKEEETKERYVKREKQGRINREEEGAGRIRGREEKFNRRGK